MAPKCSIEDCPNPVRARGLCQPHYLKARKAGTLPPLVPRTRKVRPPCSVEGCGTESRTKGLCNRHYENMRIRGRLGSRWEDTIEDRLTYTVVGECWEFSGRRNDSGYGLVTLTRRGVANARAHRLAYETWVGPIPDGLIIRHTCDNPPCINPAHLIPGTDKCNVADMIERGRDRKHDNVANVLTWEIVDDIRRRRAAGERHVDIAAAVGRSYGAVREAALGVTWPESARPT